MSRRIGRTPHHPEPGNGGLILMALWVLALAVSLAARPAAANGTGTTLYLPSIAIGAAAATPTPTATPTTNILRIVELEPMGQHEYISIRNDGPTDQMMTSWRIISVVGPQTYTFPPGFVLAAGATVRVHSGPAAPPDGPPTDLRWSTGHIWRNEGDKAILRNASGDAVDDHCYGDYCG